MFFDKNSLEGFKAAGVVASRPSKLTFMCIFGRAHRIVVPSESKLLFSEFGEWCVEKEDVALCGGHVNLIARTKSILPPKITHEFDIARKST